jgi:hypothetical protein
VDQGLRRDLDRSQAHHVDRRIGHPPVDAQRRRWTIPSDLGRRRGEAQRIQPDTSPVERPS